MAASLAPPRIRVGMIGYGQMGRIHAHAYRAIPIFYEPLAAVPVLQAVADVVPGVAERAAARAGFAWHTEDWRRVVESPDVDVIDICTPNSEHLPVLEAAIAAGKHIYCEKPLCTGLDDARAVLAAARRAGIVHQVSAEYRFVPALTCARELVRQGALGDIFHFRGLYLHSGYVDPRRPMAWRLRRAATGGGVLMDLGPHVIDQMRQLVGDAAEVLGTVQTFIRRRPLAERPGETAEVDVEDAAQAMVRFPGGAVGSLEFTRCATGTEDEMRIEVHGSRGALRFNLMDPNWLYYYDLDKPEAERGFARLATVQRYPAPAVAPAPKFAIGWTRAHVAAQFAFLEAVAQGRPAEPSFADAAAVHAHIDAIYRSAAGAGWAAVPRVE